MTFKANSLSKLPDEDSKDSEVQSFWVPQNSCYHSLLYSAWSTHSAYRSMTAEKGLIILSAGP